MAEQFVVKVKAKQAKSKYPIELMFKAVECPFKNGEKVLLLTGESGSIYEDGHGNSAYLRNDGQVYIHFLPDNAIDLDDVESFPLSYFGDYEVIYDKTVFENISESKNTTPTTEDLLKEIEKLKASRDWYRKRVDLLQQEQSKMRDPERIIVCDILANGLVWHDPIRYENKNPHNLDVIVGKMLESNGNETWYVYLQKDGNKNIFDSFQIYSGNKENEAKYFADELKYFLGLGEEPDILNYQEKKNV